MKKEYVVLVLRYKFVQEHQTLQATSEIIFQNFAQNCPALSESQHCIGASKNKRLSAKK